VIRPPLGGWVARRTTKEIGIVRADFASVRLANRFQLGQETGLHIHQLPPHISLHQGTGIVVELAAGQLGGKFGKRELFVVIQRQRGEVRVENIEGGNVFRTVAAIVVLSDISLCSRIMRLLLLRLLSVCRAVCGGRPRLCGLGHICI
jgi:hypothetical protein